MSNITSENNIIVEQVDHVKVLGITVSKHLTWTRHIDSIVKKAGTRVYACIVYQLKRAGVARSDLVTVNNTNNNNNNFINVDFV